MNPGAKKRILILATRHNAADGRVFQLEARALARAGHDVTMFVPRGKDQPASWDADGVHIITFVKHPNMILRKFDSVRQIASFALKTPADVFHVHEMDASLLGAVRPFGETHLRQP